MKGRNSPLSKRGGRGDFSLVIYPENKNSEINTPEL
jgi:hypothetical protein